MCLVGYARTTMLIQYNFLKLEQILHCVAGFCKLLVLVTSKHKLLQDRIQLE